MHDLAARHPSIGQRLDFLEKELGHSAVKHARRAEVMYAMKQAHGKLSGGVQKHTSLEERGDDI